jgi:hypothetical protein
VVDSEEYLGFSYHLFGDKALEVYECVFVSEAHLHELFTSRFSINRDLNYILSLSVRLNLIEAE